MFLLDALGQDLHYAFRGLRNNKGLTCAIVVTLALGLGVNAAVFSLLDRLFVRPPAGVIAPQSVRRVYVAQREGREYVSTDRFNYPQWIDLRDAALQSAASRNAASSTPITAYAVDSVSFNNGPRVSRVVTTYIDSEYFSLLGIHVARGRVFTAAETRIEFSSSVAIVSDAFWHRELGGDPNVIGKQLRLGSLVYAVIGVAPRDFTGTDLDATQLWLPLGAMPMPGVGNAQQWYQIRGVRLLRVLTRPPSDVSTSALETQLTSAFRIGSLAANYRRDSSAVVSTSSVISALGPLKKQQEIALAARLPWVSIFVLLISCANIANLLLARAMRRRREIAVRLALGISRQRLAVQLLLESGLLALLSSAVAVIAGAWAGALLKRALMPQIHWSEGLIDWRLAVLISCISLVAALATGLAPILNAWRIDLATLLKSGSRGRSESSSRLHGTLVIMQTALAVTLLCAAGFCIQSLRHVLGVDLGYDVEHVLIAEPRLVDARGGEDEIPRAIRSSALAEAARRLRTSDRSGIHDVALASIGPMRGSFLTATRVAGMDSTPTLDGQSPAVNFVSSEYANVVGMHMMRGRFLQLDDREGSPLVAVVNETMAKTVWRDRDPIGECVKVYGSDRPCYTIVGVVRNSRRENVVESPTMQYYVSLEQASVTGGAGAPRALVVRYVDGQAAIAIASVNRVLRDVLPSADASVHSMNALLAKQFHPWQLAASLFASLGALALLIALIGLYGVIALNVSRRTHEIGVRIALGSSRARVLRLVIHEGLQTTVIGIACGLALTIAGGRLLSTLLYDASPYDPVVLVGAAILMLITAVLSCSAPALRATRADPVEALRAE